MTTQENWDDAISSLIKWENELNEHNNEILDSINYHPNDFEELMDYGCIQITNKIEWVDEPKFKLIKNPEVFGVFTLKHVDQWCTNIEGDSFSGFMYIKVNGFNKWLKIPYST